MKDGGAGRSGGKGRQKWQWRMVGGAMEDASTTQPLKIKGSKVTKNGYKVVIDKEIGKVQNWHHFLQSFDLCWKSRHFGKVHWHGHRNSMGQGAMAPTLLTCSKVLRCFQSGSC